MVDATGVQALMTMIETSFGENVLVRLKIYYNGFSHSVEISDGIFKDHIYFLS